MEKLASILNDAESSLSEERASDQATRLNDLSVKFVGKNTRALWGSFTAEQKDAILDDAEDSERKNWDDIADAMCSDA